tara:strand:+ start:158 stop:526 length:369 start_codon:yes stop_codon:yes gene_type:complete
MIGVLWPTNVSSQKQEYSYEWKKGDSVTVAIICRTEEDIMKVLEADTKSEEETLAKMYALTAIRKCLQLPMPLPFYVMGVFVEYKDFADRPSVVLAISRHDMKEKLFGYVIAAGKQGKDQGI